MYSTIQRAVCLRFLTQLLVLPAAVCGQNQQIYAIQPLPLEVSAAQTVSLSFATAVKSLDRGSADLMAQKAKGTDNVVLVKAARKEIAPTSLIVITADGDLHTFQVSYQPHPSSIGLQILPKALRPQPVQLTQTIDERQIQDGLRLALQQGGNLSRKSSIGGISLTVQGLYILGPLLYARLSIENRSVIDYELETLRILTSENKQLRRSASQQHELPLLGRSSPAGQVKAREQQTLIVAFGKITLPDSKSLLIQLTEQGGSRHLTVRLKAKHLAKVAMLSEASNH